MDGRKLKLLKNNINGSLNSETYSSSLKNLCKIIQKNKDISYGDILFIGSTYETRQEYGFAIVKNKEKGISIGGDDGISIALDEKEFQNANLKYKWAISDMKENDPEIYEMFSYWGEEEENQIENEYKKKKMWD